MLDQLHPWLAQLRPGQVWVLQKAVWSACSGRMAMPGQSKRCYLAEQHQVHYGHTAQAASRGTAASALEAGVTVGVTRMQVA